MPRNGLTALRRGRAPESSTAPRAWSPPGSSVVAIASGMSRPLISTTRLRNGSSGLVMNEKSKSGPACNGLQYPGDAPCGCQIPTNRRTGAAAVNRVGVSAGTIDSSSGSASVTPAPRRNVRRAMCFLAMNISQSPRLVRRGRKVGRLLAHLELWTAHHPQHECREAVVFLRCVTDDGANGRHVRVFHASPHRVGHELLREHPDELR